MFSRLDFDLRDPKGLVHATRSVGPSPTSISVDETDVKDKVSCTLIENNQHICQHTTSLLSQTSLLLSFE